MKTLTKLWHFSISWFCRQVKNHFFPNRKLALAFSLAFVFPMILFAQDADTPKALKADNEEIRALTEKVDPNGWLFFSGEIPLMEGDLFSKHAEAMGLGSEDQMVVKSDFSDELGHTRVKYQQEHNRIPVDGGEYIVHIVDCIEFLATGFIVEGLNVSSEPSISQDEAFQLALEATRAESFAWENEEWETELQEDEDNPNATYLPSPELVIAQPLGESGTSENFSLVYRYMIQTVEPAQLLQVDINAMNGQTVNMINTTIDCFSHLHTEGSANHDHSEHAHENDAENCEEEYFANGTAPLIYYGTQTIQTKKRGWPFNDYYLKDETRGNGIKTKDYCCSGKIKDGDNTWPANKGKYTQAHWTCARSWDYFKNVHGLNGTNGSGKKVKVKSNWNSVPPNANYSGGWFGQRINIGISNGQHLSTMDIMAHEYTHGVTKYSANLKYQGESGALNESFSDIFGTMAEDYANAGAFDWTMGEDASWVIRDMSHPPSYGQPDTYQGANWADPNDPYDNGGVHINSGVQNKWFYLLSQGGTHNGVAVQGIGRTKAAKIAFRNLQNYLGKNSDFADSRVGAIQSAIDLYGKCSNEEIQTTNAWAAVNVGDEFQGDCVKIFGPHYVCVYGFNMLPVTYKATGLPGSVFTWSQIPSNWNYTIYGAGNKYLKLNSVNVPPSSLPTTANIKVTSSKGGSDYHYVTLDDCSFDPCGDIE